MSILITGGAGYIGSHLVRALVRRGDRVVVIDNFLSGHRDALPPDVPLLEADIANGPAVSDFMRAHDVRSVIHFASRIQVGESVSNPRLYYAGSLGASIALLEQALSVGVRDFVFSSTAAVYGIPSTVPISEDHPCAPINPYGETKLATERMLAAYGKAYGLRWAALRYFNAAGADAEGGIGERHEPETHLIPLVLDAALGKRQVVTVFGTDYPTPDGSCVRDYIHVSDLADAHLAALEYLGRGAESGPFNLGSGAGHSVNEVIAACAAVTGRAIDVSYGPRREGDPAALVASPERANTLLNWRATRSSLENIVKTAWAFHRGGSR